MVLAFSIFRRYSIAAQESDYSGYAFYMEERLEKTIDGRYVTDSMEEILQHGSKDFRMSVHKTVVPPNADLLKNTIKGR